MSLGWLARTSQGLAVKLYNGGQPRDALQLLEACLAIAALATGGDCGGGSGGSGGDGEVALMLVAHDQARRAASHRVPSPSLNPGPHPGSTPGPKPGFIPEFEHWL